MIVDTRTTAPLALVDRWVATHISVAVSRGEEVLCAQDTMKRTCHRTRVEQCRLAPSNLGRSSPRPPCLRFADDINYGAQSKTTCALLTHRPNLGDGRHIRRVESILQQVALVRNDLLEKLDGVRAGNRAYIQVHWDNQDRLNLP